MTQPGTLELADTTGDRPSGQRLDKWLWYVRVVRTRTLAAKLVTEGKVRVNRVKTVKPGHAIKPGDTMTIVVGEQVRVLQMLASGSRRGPASEAAALFTDLTPAPIPAREAIKGSSAVARDAGSGRPTKRDRRKIDRLQGHSD